MKHEISKMQFLVQVTKMPLEVPNLPVIKRIQENIFDPPLFEKSELIYNVDCKISTIRKSFCPGSNALCVEEAVRMVHGKMVAGLTMCCTLFLSCCGCIKILFHSLPMAKSLFCTRTLNVLYLKKLMLLDIFILS